MNALTATVDLNNKLVFLGTGTSTGVPLLGCDCSVCTSDDPKNSRTRSSIALGLPDGVLVVDTTPDFRSQLLREGIGDVGSVFYTHAHADHIFGLDDLRTFSLRTGRPTPVFCDATVEARLRRSFDYAFAEPNGGYFVVPRLQLHSLRPGESFDVLGARATPIPLLHGDLEILGLRVGDVAYCTDVKTIPESSRPLLEGLDLLILGALRRRPHPTHFNLEEALVEAERIGARRTLFTHISHEFDHETVQRELPQAVELAFDGLRAPLARTLQ